VTALYIFLSILLNPSSQSSFKTPTNQLLALKVKSPTIKSTSFRLRIILLFQGLAKSLEQPEVKEWLATTKDTLMGDKPGKLFLDCIKQYIKHQFSHPFPQPDSHSNIWNLLTLTYFKELYCDVVL
jgi:hypothetical protein